jgi:DNA repair exonuclease SbcCD ATPase subunit
MITLKTLGWSNAFSYGSNNSIDFSRADLTQLIGKNGHGKSSIALILEEVLYNKNSKNVKKSDILNRYSGAKSYSIGLIFEKDGDDYDIHTVRGTTQTVKLLKNGKDISAHTSTGTYKLIEEIIGFDHKTFTQIVYQSDALNLEFLTATDTARKKFLIDLLDLGIYNKVGDIFKAAAKETSTESELINLKVKTITDWIAKFSKEDLNKRELVDVPEPPTEQATKLSILEEQLRNIDSTNKKVIQNNKYKEILSGISLDSVSTPNKDITALKVKYAETIKKRQETEKIINGTGPISDKCTLCGQPVDNSHKLKMLEEAKASINQYKFDEEMAGGAVALAIEQQTKYDKYISNQREWERYHSLIDPTMSKTLLDRGDLETKIKNLQSEIRVKSAAIAAAQAANNTISAHNARIEVVSAQMSSMRTELDKHLTVSTDLVDKLSTLQLLVKTFSTTGLVAYKIECLVKDLEKITNEYLLDMSDGQFQLSFKINSSDKLNVVVNDNGHDVDIQALSNGECARVNVSTLLAIRKLMQSLSNSRINLLILDETIGSLDAEGKEKLIEVLLKEEHLNTVIVSHEFSHPLIEKVHVIKENKISRIE